MAADGSIRRAVRDRLLGEMLGSVNDPIGGGWKVLVLDEVTTRIMSSAVKMSDILDTGVSVVEDLYKRREPLQLAAVYFISPTPAAVNRLVADFASKPLYPSVHIFFSSRVSAEAVDKIKRTDALLPLLRSLKEVNAEFLMVDGRTISTGQPQALVKLMGDRCEMERAEGERELDVAALRLTTLLATLGEYPATRYRAGKPPEPGDAPGSNARSVLTQRLAAKVTERTMVMQRAGQLPGRETCDLIILDRSVDPVAPAIHEWTYESMVYDLLNVNDNIVRYTAESQSGKQESRDHTLDDNDALWVELRHSHIADVYTTLAKRFGDFQEKNRAAKGFNSTTGAAMSTSNIRSLIAALPQFRDVLSQLSLHIFLSSEIKNATNSGALTDIGELEQDLVYGDKGSTELIKFMAERSANLSLQDKQRLFVCYLATHPEKLDSTKRAQWQKLARLDAPAMAAVCNLQHLGVAVMKQPASASKGLSFSLSKNKKKGAKGTYTKRPGRAEGAYALSRFDPLLLDVAEDAASGKLPMDEFPFVRPPQDADDFAANEAVRVASARTNKSAGNWARRGVGADGAGAAVGSGSSPSSPMVGAAAGRRLVLFVIGGVTRSEMRAVHSISKTLNRDVLLVSTDVLTPNRYLEALGQLSTLDEM